MLISFSLQAAVTAMLLCLAVFALLERWCARSAFICDGQVAATAAKAELLEKAERPKQRDYLGSM